MKSYINFFELMSEYESYKNGEDFILPNVNLISENNELIFNPYVEPVSPNIVCIYDVTDVAQETKLCSEYVTCITTIIVDGEEKEFEQYYQFDTVGKHTVEFVIDDNAKYQFDEWGSYSYHFFVNCVCLISIELPDYTYAINCEFITASNVGEIICHAKTAPEYTSAFRNAKPNGILKYPKGSDYSTWLDPDKAVDSYDGNLGTYGWTGVEI